MAQMRKFSALKVAAFLLIFSMTAAAQFGFPKKSNKGETAASQGPGDQSVLIQNKLISQINLTKITADRSDIVTAGDIIVLHKDGLMMCSTDSAYAYSNTYDNGVLTANQKNRARDAAVTGTKTAIMGRLGLGNGDSPADAANNACASRQFVAGEKFWVTGIVAQRDGILISTYSDPYNDVRYYGEIKFRFANGSVPTVDDFVKTVFEVITVQPAEGQGDQSNQGNQGDQGSQPAAAPADQAPPSDIAPQSPPADTPPPTIALGQTKDEVIAAFGQPMRIAKLGVKEIFYYKDMKVTFTNGKVSNVE
ncbi:MAG TPA: hypothetical protein VGE85_12640 [Terracidiphilus sp.]|jgi:hypothetical protein